MVWAVVAIKLHRINILRYFNVLIPLGFVQASGGERLVCGLRAADGRSVLLGEKGHPDADFLLIFFNDRLQNRNEIFFPLGVPLVGYIATNLAQQIDVIHECDCPSNKQFSYKAKGSGIQEFVYGIAPECSPMRPVRNQATRDVFEPARGSFWDFDNSALRVRRTDGSIASPPARLGGEGRNECCKH